MPMPTQKPTKNQLLSDQLAIYCDAPVYKAHSYVTEELLMDRRRKKQLSGQLIFDDSVKRLWAIRRYRVGIFRSVSVGISRYLPYQYRRKTWSLFSVSKFWREPLKKLAGAPFILRRGGLGPLFVHFTLLLKKKGIPAEFFKKRVPAKT
jgi:hypothetical protein